MLNKISFVILCLIFIVLTPNPSVAQTDPVGSSSVSVSFDSSYLEDYTNLLTARAFLLFQNASLLIHPEGDNIPKLVYVPNANLRIGVAGFWRWFGLGLSIDNPFYKTDQAAYGKTTTIDLRVNAFGRSVAGELFFQQYKGYYITSPEKPDKTHYLIPEMKTYSLGLSGYWISNAKRFSIRAAFIQNERQKRSAGSFVLRPSFLFYHISSDHGIIPQEFVNEYHIPSSKLISDGKFYSLGLSPGYIYTLVFLKHFYLTGALFPGIAGQYSKYRNDLNRTTDFGFAFQLSGRFAIGYNSKNWFLGGSYQTGFNEIPDKLIQSVASYGIAQFRFWGGMRFDVFKHVPRATSWTSGISPSGASAKRASWK
ncbi:MAG: DUF4421 family protein [Bacteroidota bacterium]